ncbi:unnamed protein product [Ilex paraguariensis]|uniref:CRM domain-containing protein n=1 Tax=Ilex paraguariensis TaxID=185542 RepID=A0ABC8RAQ3_9AQUA
MGALSSLSSQLILRYIFRSPPPPPPPTSFSVFKPLHATSLRTTSAFFSSLSSPPFLFSSPSISLSSPPPFPLCLCNPQTLVENPINTVETYEDDSDYGELESGDEDFESEKENLNRVLDSSVSGADKVSVSKLPSLTVKEKKELASYAHSLGKKLKSQQVGKSGVTDSVATSLIETLEANELLKGSKLFSGFFAVRMSEHCTLEVVKLGLGLHPSNCAMLCGLKHCTLEVVKLGLGLHPPNCAMLPSLAKLKAEEKKKQAKRVFAKRQLASNPSLQTIAESVVSLGNMQNQGQGQRGSARGRRGISRF